LETVLTSDKLQILSEDALLEALLQFPPEDRWLLRYVFLEFLSPSWVQKFASEVDFADLDHAMWQNVMTWLCGNIDT
jgi:hypothetical protein